MQTVKAATVWSRPRSDSARWPALGLCMMLMACQAPQVGPPTGAAPQSQSQTPHGAAAPATAVALPQTPVAPKRAPAPAAHGAPPTLASNAPITDEDGNPHRPDDSYNRANRRPEYDKCVDASDAVTLALQACGDEEYRWQRQRMIAALDVIDAGPDSVSKDKLMDEQDAYMNDTDRYCRFDPDTQGQGQMLDAQSCRINRLANRADALEKLISK